MKYDLYGVGNAIMDIQVRVDDAFLERCGIEKGVMTLVDAERQRELLDALAGHPRNYCSGGSAANTIVGVAEMGGRCAYACLTGDDRFGRMYLEEMRSLGIEVGIRPVADGVSGSCLVLVTPDAQRTMLTHLGASAGLGREHLEEADIGAARWLYVEGYLFAGDATRGAALEAIDRARSAGGVQVALTLSDPFIVEVARETLASLIERGAIDLLFCNELEGRALAGCDAPEECARWMGRRVPAVALTMGAKGSLILHDGILEEIDGVAVDAVDTTGAGDMYAAGVLYGITHGRSWREAGEIGSRAAARIVTRPGARLGAGAAEVSAGLPG
ncbi:MAG: adenosine kinase [Zetaproteobacteria bacterium]|nr:MAG: adenosine kinase [Zetaproteobacteria bacterium]